MPELPEVETTRRGIAPHLKDRRLKQVVVRQGRLRWPVPPAVKNLRDVAITGLRRRAKYLLLETLAGEIIIHLGMSGALRVLAEDTPPGKHDHVDFLLDSGQVVRLTDPRRFGAVLWTPDPGHHPLLNDLGPEPLGPDFSGEWLFQRSRGRRQSVKTFIMDNHTVVGVGKNYAAESLFRAGIHPSRAAGRIARARYDRLAEAIRATLKDAIKAGGTTLRDFTRSDGRPGYFRQSLAVYGRAGEPCKARRDKPRQNAR